VEREFYTDEHGFKYKLIKSPHGRSEPMKLCEGGFYPEETERNEKCFHYGKGKDAEPKSGKRPCELSDFDENQCYHLRPYSAKRDYYITEAERKDIYEPPQRFEFSKKAVTGK